MIVGHFTMRKKAYENLINYYLEFLFEKEICPRLKLKYKFKLHYFILFRFK